jgi:hypothetical protein
MIAELTNGSRNQSNYTALSFLCFATNTLIKMWGWQNLVCILAMRAGIKVLLHDQQTLKLLPRRTDRSLPGNALLDLTNEVW